MSRHVFVGKKYEIVVGVDKTTGAFFQIWKCPQEDQDEALIVIDNRGVQKRDGWEALPAQALRYITELEKQLKQQPGCYAAAQEFAYLAERVGFFGDITRQIYMILE